MSITTRAALATVLLTSLACAGAAPTVHTDQSACMDGSVAQFGRYIGDWKITDEQLAKDGRPFKRCRIIGAALHGQSPLPGRG
jgi:hypothetical protein